MVGSSAVRDAVLLDLDISERLCAEIGHISQCRNEDGGVRMGEVETGDKFSIDPPEWNALDPCVPNDILNKVHCDTDGTYIG